MEGYILTLCLEGWYLGNTLNSDDRQHGWNFVHKNGFREGLISEHFYFNRYVM